MKKVVMVLGALIALLIIAVISIPMFYDVNTKLRPMIVEAIEQNTNAKAEIGKLSLSLWTGIKVHIEGVSLKEVGATDPVFAVGAADLEIPFSAFLAGRFEATFVATAPKINVVKTKEGMNISHIMKSKPSEKPEEAKATDTKSAPKKNVDISGIAISLRIEKASLQYKDMVANQTSQIEDLSLAITNIGLNTPIKMKVGADMKFQNAMAKLNGPLLVDGTATVRLNPEFDFTMQAKVNLDKLALTAAGLINKAKDVPLRLDADVHVTEKIAELKSVDFVVNDFKITTKGKVENFDNPEINMIVSSNELDFKHWQGVVAPLKDFSMAGKFSLQLALSGTPSALKYNGALKLAGASLKVPALLVPITELNSEVKFETNVVRLEKTSMKMGASDLSLSGEVANFEAPKISVKVNSNLLDLDQMLGLANEKAKTEEETAIKKDETITPEERDRRLEALAKGPIHALKSNPMARKVSFNSITNIKKMVMKKMSITDFTTDFEFKNLVMSLNKAKLNVFNGSVQANTKIDFNAEDPVYSLGGEVAGLDLNTALESQLPSLKDTITGKTFAKFDINGQGVTVAKAKQFLKGKGNFKIEGGTWSGLSALKMISEKLEKIPQAKDTASKIRVGNKFRQLSANFNIANGNFNLENAVMDLEEANVTFTAKGWVNFDQQQNLVASLLVPADANTPSELKAKDGRMQIPIEMDGALKSPNIKWDKTTTPIANAYLKHEGAKAIKKGVEELKKNPEVQKALDKAPDKVKDLLKGIGM